MSDWKRGLEDKYQWLVHQDLSSIVREELLDRFMYWMREKVVVFYSQVRVYTMNVWELFYFYVIRQSKVWTRRTNRTDCHFMRCFISKWGFTPWTERIISGFRIEDSCFEFEETEWIIVQNIELGYFSSSRYSSYNEGYFLLKYEQEDK